MNVLRSYAYLFGRYRRRYVVGLLALAITNLIYMSIPRLLALPRSPREPLPASGESPPGGSPAARNGSEFPLQRNFPSAIRCLPTAFAMTEKKH